MFVQPRPCIPTPDSPIRTLWMNIGIFLEYDPIIQAFQQCWRGAFHTEWKHLYNIHYATYVAVAVSQDSFPDLVRIRNTILSSDQLHGIDSADCLGFALLTRKSDRRIPHKPECFMIYTIEEVMCRPGLERRGIGTALMRRVLHEANAMRIKILFLTSAQKLLSWYGTFGFRAVLLDSEPQALTP